MADKQTTEERAELLKSLEEMRERYAQLQRTEKEKADAAKQVQDLTQRLAPTYIPTPRTLQRSDTCFQPTITSTYQPVVQAFGKPRPTIVKNRAKPMRKPMASAVAPIVGTAYQPVFELMETKATVEFRGEVSRIYNNKDVFIDLTEVVVTDAQREDGVYKVNNGLEQLERAGLPRDLVNATHPANIAMPYKVFDNQLFAKVKVTDQALLAPLVDTEEQYGYKVGATVRVVCKTSTWNGWKGDDAGIIFYVQSLEVVKDEPLF